MPGWLVAYIMLTIFAGALNAVLAFYTWHHREATGARAFVAMLLSITLWSVLAYLEALLPDYSHTFRLLKYISIAPVPVALFVFAVQYSGMGRWITARRVLLFCIMPVLTQIVIWSPWRVPLWWHEDFSRGFWFLMHSIYSFGLVFIGFILMGVTVLRSSALRRRQIVLIMLGLSAPLLLNIGLTFGLVPYVVDWSPLAFTLTGIVLAWTLYRHRLFDLTPLARETLIDGMHDGMVVLNTRHVVQDVNPTASDILGIEADALVGQSLTHMPDVWLQLADLITTPVSGVGARELDIVGLDGEERAYEVDVTLLHDSEATLSGYLLVFHDITERRAHERAIQRYTEELETRNAELDAFAHTVAHDLKTPLTTLVGFSHLLNQRAARWSSEEIASTAARLARTGEKMATIIDELLLLSNVRKSEDVTCVPLEMAAILAEVEERLTGMVAQSDAVIVMEEEAATWPVAAGYAPWVEAVWANYVSNAIKYGGNPPHVTLGATVLDFGLPILDETAPVFISKIKNPKSKIVFWVRDNGPGLTPEQQAQLFTPFTRLHKDRAEGHGLGLSIVERIVAKLGGEVGVTSKVGQGATFWFTLPAAEAGGDSAKEHATLKTQ